MITRENTKKKKEVTMTTVQMVLIVSIMVLFGTVKLVFNYMNINMGYVEPEKYTLDTGEIYSNISGSRKIIKTNITIETHDKKTIENITEKNYMVRDEINKILRNKKRDELDIVELKEEIKEMLIEKVDKNISEIYFVEFITN